MQDHHDELMQINKKMRDQELPREKMGILDNWGQVGTQDFESLSAKCQDLAERDKREK